MKKIMITFRDPLTGSPCVRWFINLVNARKFIRSLSFNVPYKITVDEDYEFRGSYFVLDDIFIEFPKFGKVEIDGGVYDKNI